MEARELSIGNYYQLNDGVLGGGVHQIKNGKDLSLAYDLLKDELLYPIKITEEWLINFGFEKKEIRSMYDNRDEYTFKNTVITLHEMSPNFYMSKHCNVATAFQDEKGVYKYLKLEHVHQLQNIYWCLCSEELTINE